MSSMPIRRPGSMFNPSAQIKALQNLNKNRVTGQMALPFSPVGNEQARNSALAPAAGFSTTNPTGAQTAMNAAPQDDYPRRPAFGGGGGMMYGQKSVYEPPGGPPLGTAPSAITAPSSFKTPQSAMPSSPFVPISNVQRSSSLFGGDSSLVPPGGFTGASPSIFTSPGSDTLSSPAMVENNFERQGGTIDRIRNAPITAARRPEVVADFQRQKEEKQAAMDSAYQQGSVSATGMTPDERAAWTPEAGYNFGSNLIDGAATGGAIGAGMSRRFGSGSALAAAETSEKFPRRMSDEDAMKKSEDAMKARVPERGVLAAPGTGFTRTNKAGEKAYTSRAQFARDQLAAAEKSNDVAEVQKWKSEVDQINQEQAATKSRHEAQKARWREAHGGMREREFKKIKRMESALSKGNISQQQLDSAKSEIQEKIDKGFGRSALGSSAAAASAPKAIGVDGQYDQETRSKARDTVRAIVSPETAAAPGPMSKIAQSAQAIGLAEDDTFDGMNQKIASIPVDTWDEILKNPDSVRDTVRAIQEFYRSKKEADRGFAHHDSNSGNQRFSAGKLREGAERYEGLLGIDQNDINAMTSWLLMYRNSRAGGPKVPEASSGGVQFEAVPFQ